LSADEKNLYTLRKRNDNFIAVLKILDERERTHSKKVPTGKSTTKKFYFNK
jgi:hypothetical protein